METRSAQGPPHQPCTFGHGRVRNADHGRQFSQFIRCALVATMKRGRCQAVSNSTAAPQPRFSPENTSVGTWHAPIAPGAISFRSVHGERIERRRKPNGPHDETARRIRPPSLRTGPARTASAFAPTPISVGRAVLRTVAAKRALQSPKSLRLLAPHPKRVRSSRAGLRAERHC